MAEAEAEAETARLASAPHALILARATPPSSPPTPSKLHRDSFFFPSPTLLHRLRRRPASDDDAFLTLPRFFSPFPSPSSFVSFATSDNDASLPMLTPRRSERTSSRNPAARIRHDHDAGLPSAATASLAPSFAAAAASPAPPLLRSRRLPRASFSFAAAASPRPPSLSQPPPPRALSFPFAAAASPAPPFPFAAAASPAPPSPSQPPPPSRGGGSGGVAAHGNPAWAEVGALARRGALNARRAELTARPGAAANAGEQGEREGGIRIARVGSVVVASVHQPSRCVLGLVDRLLILSRCRTAYCGDPRRLADFLAAFGCPIPAGETPAEFALDAVYSSSPAHRRRSPSSTPLLLIGLANERAGSRSTRVRLDIWLARARLEIK
uniref:Uncharacterized protein n=1 Tax=Ananas comosus var. bracteatus TaxID=296719 RepID=A0A6V7NUE3_ANACO|nr:unnamed protein product [Ananas comosus var. bracteatus]